ncbi:hypothetical protein N8584_00520 [bacterium]|nr:hypothetical protein [bacterium]
MSDKESDLTYDILIVGSSPLMLLHAIKLAKSHKKVCLVDKESALGGCWRYDFLDDLQIESACHLIEPFNGIYSLLEELTEVEFTPLDPQPVRLYRFGLLPKFSTRGFLLCRFLKSILTIIASKLSNVLDFLRFVDRDKIEALTLRAIDCRAEVLDFFRFHVPLFLSPYLVVKGPKVGYVGLVNALEQSALHYGVSIMEKKVVELESVAGVWSVATQDGETLHCKEVVLTSSTGLEIEDGGIYKFTEQRSFLKRHILVSVPTKQINIAQTYVHVGIKSKFARLFQIIQDKFDDKVLYLLEVKRGEDPDHEDIIELLKMCKISKFGAEVSIEEKFTMELNRPSKKMLPEGYATSGLLILSSRANLASGILNWNRRTFRHSLGKWATEPS